MLGIVAAPSVATSRILAEPLQDLTAVQAVRQVFLHESHQGGAGEVADQAHSKANIG